MYKYFFEIYLDLPQFIYKRHPNTHALILTLTSAAITEKQLHARILGVG